MEEVFVVDDFVFDFGSSLSEGVSHGCRSEDSFFFQERKAQVELTVRHSDATIISQICTGGLSSINKSTLSLIIKTSSYSTNCCG